jgi:hypothetical protein
MLLLFFNILFEAQDPHKKLSKALAITVVKFNLWSQRLGSSLESTVLLTLVKSLNFLKSQFLYQKERKNTTYPQCFKDQLMYSFALISATILSSYQKLSGRAEFKARQSRRVHAHSHCPSCLTHLCILKALFKRHNSRYVPAYHSHFFGQTKPSLFES